MVSRDSGQTLVDSSLATRKAVGKSENIRLKTAVGALDNFSIKVRNIKATKNSIQPVNTDIGFFARDDTVSTPRGTIPTTNQQSIMSMAILSWWRVLKIIVATGYTCNK